MVELSGRLVTLEQAKDMIPWCNVNALRVWLYMRRDRYTPRYRRVGLRKYRVLYESEIRAIQSDIVKYEYHSRSKTLAARAHS